MKTHHSPSTCSGFAGFRFNSQFFCLFMSCTRPLAVWNMFSPGNEPELRNIQNACHNPAEFTGNKMFYRVVCKWKGDKNKQIIFVVVFFVHTGRNPEQVIIVLMCFTTYSEKPVYVPQEFLIQLCVITWR